MARYVYDRQAGRMVDKDTGEPSVAGPWKPVVPMVVRPFKPYRSEVDGTEITDRRQEREHMKKNDVVHATEIRKLKPFRNRRFVEKHRLWDRAEVDEAKR